MSYYGYIGEGVPRRTWRRARPLSQTGSVHLSDPSFPNGVRCNAAGSVNATSDLASVDCAFCLNLHRNGRNGPGY